MYYEIYLDFYFLENLFTDCAMLVLTAVLMREKWKGKNILCAGFLESMVSCLLIVLSIRNVAVTRIFQLFMTFLMISLGLGKKKRKDIAFGVLLFYLISFCFGGAVLAVAEAGKWPLPPVKLVLFLLLWLQLSICMKEKNSREHIYETEIFYQGNSRRLKALYDTGNRLREPYQKRPVNIIEYGKVKDLLTGDEKTFLIPYQTVSGGGNLFTGMTFDRMTVSKGKKTEIYEHPVMALAKEKLSSDDSYQMILHPDNRKDQEEKYNVENSSPTEISVQNGKRMAECMVSENQ